MNITANAKNAYQVEVSSYGSIIESVFGQLTASVELKEDEVYLSEFYKEGNIHWKGYCMGTELVKALQSSFEDGVDQVTVALIKDPENKTTLHNY